MTRARTPVASTRSATAAAAVTVLVLFASLGAARPAAAASCTDSDARAGVVVRVVVDDGATVAATDVCVPDGATGQDALVERARVLGRPAPRTDARFLAFLCAIDGVPDRGCGVDNSADRYWAYWTATAGAETWTYAPIGMADRRLRAGDVDGWRLLPIGGRKLAPRTCPTGIACAPSAPTTAAPPTTAPTAAPAPVVAAPGPASSGAAATAPPAPSARRSTPGAGAPTIPGGPTGGGGPTTTDAVDPAAAPPTTAVADDAAAPVEVAGRVVARGDPPTDASTRAPNGALRSAPQAGDDDGRGSAAGTIAAVAALVAAGTLALVQSRRTRLRR